MQLQTRSSVMPFLYCEGSLFQHNTGPDIDMEWFVASGHGGNARTTACCATGSTTGFGSVTNIAACQCWLTFVHMPCLPAQAMVLTDPHRSPYLPYAAFCEQTVNSMYIRLPKIIGNDGLSLPAGYWKLCNHTYPALLYTIDDDRHAHHVSQATPAFACLPATVTPLGVLSAALHAIRWLRR